MMHNLFAPDGDLRFTRGRIGMNCNDYGRSWFTLIRAAQEQNPDMTFWTSPWSPPSWMKINGDYPVVSNKYNNADPRLDYLLFGAADEIDEDEMKFLGEREGKFPRPTLRC